MPGAPRPKTIPGRPFKKPVPVPSSLSSGAQQALSEGLAWDYHIGRIFENIEKDIGVEARRYISFGGPSPVRGSAYIEELAGEIGLGRRQVPFYRMADRGRAAVEVVEESPATLAEALERKSRPEAERQARLLDEREEVFSLAQKLNKDKKGQLTGEGWQNEEDQQRSFFDRKTRGQGKYQIGFTWGEVINPADWSRLVEKNLESLAYQAVYYSIEGHKYRDLVSGGRTLSQEIDDLLTVRQRLNNEIYDLDQQGIATGEKDKDGKTIFVRPSEMVQGLSYQEVEADVRRLDQGEAKARQDLKALEEQAEDFDRKNSPEELTDLRAREEKVAQDLSNLDKEREARRTDWRALRAEKKKLKEGLGEESQALLSQDEKLEGERQLLDDQREDLRQERQETQTRLKEAERKLNALNSQLTEQGLPPSQIAQTLQASPESAEVGRLKTELSGSDQRLREAGQRRMEVQERLGQGRQRLSELNPDFARVQSELRRVRNERIDLQDRLSAVRRRRADRDRSREKIKETIEQIEKAREGMEKRLKFSRSQLKAWQNARQIAAKKRVARRIDARIDKFNPKMREWFAPRSKGQHLFNGYDWDERTRTWKKGRKTSGRFWQLQDFINDPAGYAFRSFVWKGDPLPGGHSLFNVVKTEDGKFVTRFGNTPLKAGEKLMGSGLKTALLGNDKMGPLMNVLKPGSPGAHLVNFATRDILDPQKYDLFRYFGQTASQAAKRFLPIIKNLITNLLRMILDLVAKLLPKILGLLGTAGGGAAVGGAAGTAGAGAAGGVAGGGGLLAEEAGTALATGGTKPAVEATVLLVVGIILAIIAVIFLVVAFVVVIVGGGLKDFGRGGNASLVQGVVVVKTVDVLDVNGNPTGSNHLAVDGADHNIRYTISVTNNSQSGASDISLSDALCGQVFTASLVPAGTINQQLGTCQTTVLADTDKLVINQVTGTAVLEEGTVNLAATGVVIVGNPPDQPPTGWPISAGCITQGPGGAGSHRSTGSPAGNALDLSPRTTGGWNVQATHNGIAHVYYSTPSVGAGPYPYFGYYVILTSASGAFSSVYAHLASIAVTEGQSVSSGEFLGVIDSTVGPGGTTTGNHLHYGISGFVMDTPYIPAHIPSCVDDCAAVLSLNAGANCFTQ